MIGLLPQGMEIMASDVALWGLCFLLAAVALLFTGNLGLAMIAVLILVIGLITAGE
jgi:hypothetical protein